LPRMPQQLAPEAFPIRQTLKVTVINIFSRARQLRLSSTV
jgi:hypothetical protein